MSKLDVKTKEPRQNDVKEKTDCFAYKTKNICKALTIKSCMFCPFYKSTNK